MQFWKIVAGHKEKDPDEVKSVILGDWLRHNYVAIGWSPELSPQGKAFKKKMQRGDGVVVVSDGFVWALGTIKGGMKPVDLERNSHLYPYQREVKWTRVTKVAYKHFPRSLYNKLKSPKALVRLGSEDWQDLLGCL
jgi:hypothetical protein